MRGNQRARAARPGANLAEARSAEAEEDSNLEPVS